MMIEPDTFGFASEETLERLNGEKIKVAHACVRDCGGIVGAADLARRWGVSKARIGQLTRFEGFPAPLAGEGIPRWLWLEVDSWNRRRLGDESK